MTSWMAWRLVSRPRLDCVRLETVDDFDGKKMEVVGGITIERWHLGVSSGLERGLGEEALLFD